jgi:hypothetical protein
MKQVLEIQIIERMHNQRIYNVEGSKACIDITL